MENRLTSWLSTIVRNRRLTNQKQKLIFFIRCHTNAHVLCEKFGIIQKLCEKEIEKQPGLLDFIIILMKLLIGEEKLTVTIRGDAFITHTSPTGQAQRSVSHAPMKA